MVKNKYIYYMSNYLYLPQPPKDWYRVENKCTFDISNSDYYKAQQLNKGNVLQYKKNSSGLTKKQKYSQISKGLWVNRTKTFATQTDTYTNPNMSSLKRVGYTEYNSLQSLPQYIYNTSNPFNCQNPIFKDGGNLVCNAYENPCTGSITETTSSVNYSPSTDSNVPGQVTALYWNPKLQTWYPRNKTTMNNSGNKFPINYKLLTSAIKPAPPNLSLITKLNGTIELSWTNVQNKCIPTTSYNIYQNNTLLTSVSYNVLSYTLTILPNIYYNFYVTSVSNIYLSEPSNKIDYFFNS